MFLPFWTHYSEVVLEISFRDLGGQTFSTQYLHWINLIKQKNLEKTPSLCSMANLGGIGNSFLWQGLTENLVSSKNRFLKKYSIKWFGVWCRSKGLILLQNGAPNEPAQIRQVRCRHPAISVSFCSCRWLLCLDAALQTDA